MNYKTKLFQSQSVAFQSQSKGKLSSCLIMLNLCGIVAYVEI